MTKMRTETGTNKGALNTGDGRPRAALVGLSDDELLGRTRELVRRDRQTLAQLVAHLGEIDARRLYARFATSSLFDYCVRELRFSESEAFLRIRAARAARRHPALLSLIAAGELHLSGLKLIAPALDDADAAELIESARGKTSREIERLLADRRPLPSGPEQIRKLPRPGLGTTQRALTATADLRLGAPPELLIGRQARPQPSTGDAQRPTAQPLNAPGAVDLLRRCASPRQFERHRPLERPQPLGEERYKVSFTADHKLAGLLEELRALYSHRAPNADLATIISDAAKLLRDALLKRRFGVGAKPRGKAHEQPAPAERETSAAGHATASSAERQTSSGERKSSSAAHRTSLGHVVTRHVPLGVRREVFRRDGGQCSYVDENGTRCGARSLLELHHCDPWACGGDHSVQNITLRCRAHNAQAANSAKVRQRDGTLDHDGSTSQPSPVFLAAQRRPM